MYSKNIIKKIVEHAISLEEFHIKDLAWSKENSIKLINEIHDDDIIILGGDVYMKDNHKLISLGDNWYCDPKSDEKRIDYAKRSKEVALEYIKKYPINRDETILFGIVFDQQVYV